MDPLTPLPLLRILVVEDSLDAAEPLGLVLEYCGATVRLAHSVAQALGVLTTWTPDIIVTDIGMPKEDGYDFVRQLRALATPLSRLPVIAVTAFEEEEHRRRALASGFHMHLAKPVNLRELTYAIALLTGLGADTDEA
ncbi:MAG: response regulator, partial [bacterium]